MNPLIPPLRRMDTPHPMVTVLGLTVIAGLLAVGFETDFQSPLVSATSITFAIAFTAVCRHSARQERRRQEQALKALRHQPVPHLND